MFCYDVSIPVVYKYFRGVWRKGIPLSYLINEVFGGNAYHCHTCTILENIYQQISPPPNFFCFNSSQDTSTNVRLILSQIHHQFILQDFLCRILIISKFWFSGDGFHSIILLESMAKRSLHRIEWC